MPLWHGRSSIPKGGRALSSGRSISNFLRNLQINFQSSCTSLQSHQQWRRASLYSPQDSKISTRWVMSEDASIPLGREKKAITSGEGPGRESGWSWEEEWEGGGKVCVGGGGGNLTWYWVREEVWSPEGQQKECKQETSRNRRLGGPPECTRELRDERLPGLPGRYLRWNAWQ
jgi:hypothetical protein